MKPQNPTYVDLLGTGAKYQEDQTQSSRLRVIFNRICDIFEKLSDDFQAFVEIIDCSATLFKGAHGGFHQFISLTL
nr:hypothetical protein [Tanacetum cinerariifolium]